MVTVLTRSEAIERVRKGMGRSCVKDELTDAQCAEVARQFVVVEEDPLPDRLSLPWSPQRGSGPPVWILTPSLSIVGPLGQAQQLVDAWNARNARGCALSAGR